MDGKRDRRTARVARLLGGWLLGAIALAAGPARAQEPYDLDIQNFRPAMDTKGLITVERSKALGTLEPSFGLYLDYAFNPLKQDIGGDEEVLVERLGTGTFVFAIGFANIVEIGAQLPVVIVRGDPDGPGDEPSLDGDGFGDAQLSAKIRILDRERHGIGLALLPIVQLGSGEENTFVSHGQTPVFIPKLVVDWDVGSRVSMAVNAGATLREKREIAGNVTVTDEGGMATTRARDSIVTGKEFNYSAGVGIALIQQRLDLIVEGYGAVPIESGAENAMPLEVLAGLKLFLLGDSFLTAGATRGLLGDYGDPDLRLFAGIVFEPAVRDRDGDGINDDIDQCPDEAEDRDGFQDGDGCPDPDNDGDGILDIVDQCPDDPEDFNGYEDTDGCPEGNRDRDGDGILDRDDQCPDDPEDKDGFQDEDGCPDPDNDRDGILDVDDKCPMDPEDPDGFEDQDGCPDPDNDQDGLLDVDDECPNEPENFNNYKDEDGCPDTPKVVISGGKINILEKVHFETNKAVIKAESYDILNQVAETLRQNPQITSVEVQGHTDSRGSDAYNLDLSQRRAAAVRTYLIERGNIEGNRLTARGYGETKPIDPEENVQAWAKNRRVEFVIMEEGGGITP
jgi:outer membrane protein OmpA-like peptidoglycan-associated protein